MEPCLEKELVHHYESKDGRGWEQWWVGLLGEYVCGRRVSGRDGKIRFIFFMG